jgi:glycosyltransferase involved in cell wall biosynthesis
LQTMPGAPPETSKVIPMPNGTNMRSVGVDHVPYRCAYLSSPDRGLHWLLSIWPEIRYAFPMAELHVFYEIEQWFKNTRILYNDVGMRARYVASRLETLGKNHGVILRGAVAPAVLQDELARCDLMLYPCDTVSFTEGFGVSVMDACAVGAVPIITDCDAFGEVYRESGVYMVDRTGRAWVDHYRDAVLEVMETRDTLQPRRTSVQEFSKQFRWPEIAKRWEPLYTKGAI